MYTYMPNFAPVTKTIAGIWPIFDFGGRSPLCIFKSWKFYPLGQFRDLVCVIMVPVSQTIAEIWRILIFQDGSCPPSSIFKSSKFCQLGQFGGPMCHRARFCADQSNCLEIGHFSIFQDVPFQDGGRAPSWICLTRVRTTDEEYLAIFVTVQNLVGIVAVVLII